MSYAVRNSLIIGILLLIVGASGGYWVFVRQGDELKRLEKMVKEQQEKLYIAEAESAIFNELRKRLEMLKTKWEARKKVIPQSNNDTQTLAYLDEILNYPNTSIDFDFTFESTQKFGEEGKGKEENKNEEEPPARYNVYRISGEGDFENLYNFIWYLENKSTLYKLKDPSLSEKRYQVDGAPQSKITFNMILEAYFSPESTDTAKTGDSGLGAEPPSINPFGPLVYETVPPNVDELFDPDGARLLAIYRMLGRTFAYLIDKSGAEWNLAEGDEIYLGHVAWIDQKKGEIKFVQNASGIRSEIIIQLETAIEIEGDQ